MPEFVTKIIQIFDCKVARHGNMIVGKTGAGKSVAWQTLQRAMARLRKDGHESEQFQKVCHLTSKKQTAVSDALCTIPSYMASCHQLVSMYTAGQQWNRRLL